MLPTRALAVYSAVLRTGPAFGMTDDVAQVHDIANMDKNSNGDTRRANLLIS